MDIAVQRAPGRCFFPIATSPGPCRFVTKCELRLNLSGTNVEQLGRSRSRQTVSCAVKSSAWLCARMITNAGCDVYGISCNDSLV